MDADRFDALLRVLSESPTRRGVGRALAGLALGGMLSKPESAEVEAKRRKKKKKCKRGKKKCGKTCVPKANCCNATDCPVGATCEAGACICPAPGELACGEVCVNPATDGANCGTCGNVCDTDECVHGACTCSSVDDCPDGCFCSTRKQGGNACSMSAVEPQCTTDEDCPLRSVCTEFINFCSEPCLG